MIYFISDVHLGFFDREKDKLREDILLNFLEKISSDCTTLFIVGDLFDYWFEYKTVVPAYFYRTLNKLSELEKKGIKIEYVMGNHDFGHKTFFENELKIPIYKEDITRILSNKKFYIAHGDGKAYNDTGYLILRSILRNKFSLWLFSKLHPDFGIGLASGSSQKSRKYTDKKEFGEQDGMTDFAKNKIDDGYDFVVMGHRHKTDMVKHNLGIYVNLGDWIGKNPTFADFDGNDLKIKSVMDFLNE